MNETNYRCDPIGWPEKPPTKPTREPVPLPAPDAISPRDEDSFASEEIARPARSESVSADSVPEGFERFHYSPRMGLTEVTR